MKTRLGKKKCCEEMELKMEKSNIEKSNEILGEGGVRWRNDNLAITRMNEKEG